MSQILQPKDVIICTASRSLDMVMDSLVRKRQRSWGIKRWWDGKWEGVRHSKMSRQVFFKDNIARKMIFPLQILNTPAQVMLLIATKILSKCLKPALSLSSSRIAMKHWHPHTQRCETSGFVCVMTLKGIMLAASIEVGSQFWRYCKVRTASHQKDMERPESARRVWPPSSIV